MNRELGAGSSQERGGSDAQKWQGLALAMQGILSSDGGRSKKMLTTCSGHKSDPIREKYKKRIKGGKEARNNT
jgi:hypothetical protein